MKTCQILIALLCVGVLAGCGGGGSSTPGTGGTAVLQTLSITPGAPTVAAGLSQQFSATGTYSDHTKKDLTNSATWSSSNTSAATISSAGMATSNAPGSTTITATFSGISGTATLTVTSATLVSLAVAPATASVPLGATQQLTATGTFTDGSTQNMTTSVQWTSANPSVAGINANGTRGLAIGIALGSASIVATSGSVSSSATLTVTNAALRSITVSPQAPSIAQGTTVQFSATGTFTDGSLQNITNSVQWTSGNPAVAAINANGAQGLALGIAAGTSTITAASGSIVSSASLTVTSATLNSIAVTPGNVSLSLGTLQQFTATGTFSDGTTQDITSTVIWSSSDNSVASITTSGLLTARRIGSVTITAASGSVNGTASATINAADLASLAIVPGNVTIAATTSQQFSAIGTFNDGSTRDLTTQAAWTSSNTAVAKIGSGSGLARGLAPGSTTIGATVGSVGAVTTLDVTNATVVAIAVSPAGRTIPPATKLPFTATGTFSDSSTQVITHDVTWASDNVAVATITGGGVATGVATGTANISATFEGIVGSAQLNVSSVTLTSIAVTPSTAVLAPASTLGYTATGTYSDGSTQNISTAVTWTSSDPNVASVSSFGQVTGQSAGTATITAGQGSISGAASVLVESSPMTSLQITPAQATVAQQTGVQFSAIGTFADGGTQDLTNSASWTSSPVSVATVGSSGGSIGLATGLAPGAATITALFAGQVGTASLTVTNATLVSVTVAPSNASIPLGSSQRFTATGNFSDGSTENLTAQVTWTSSSVSVATISQGGLANSAAIGTTTITASMNGVSGGTTLTVF